MPYNSFKVIRNLLHKSRMGDVNDAPEIIVTDQKTNCTTTTVQDENSKSNSLDLPSPTRCNGHTTGHSIPSVSHPQDHTSIPANATSTRHGSNGSAHFISRDGDHTKPLDTTVNFIYDPSKDTDKKDEPPPSNKKRFPGLSIRAAFSHRDKKRKCLSLTKKFVASPFGVLCLILAYLSLGACIFMWMERGEESRRRHELITRRYGLTKRLIDCTEMNTDPTECLARTVVRWEQELVRDFPVLYIHLGDDNSTSPKIWNWPNAFYGCFSVITTIGYGTIAPITKWGRLFVIVYAIVGIPLMLLLVADIGGQLARVVKIVIIAVRKRRARARWGKEKQPNKDDQSPPSITIQEPADGKDSPHFKIRRETFEHNGQVNQGLEMDDEPYDNHARVAHLNGVNLHLEVAGKHHDSDSSYSSCDNGSITVSTPKRRKLRKKSNSMQKSSTEVNVSVAGNTCGCREYQSCMECIGRAQGNHGITIQIDCDDSDDSCYEKNNVHANNASDHGPYSHELYDAVDSPDSESEHSDNSNERPPTSSEHQIKEYDSVSQSGDHQDNTAGSMLGVPRFRSTLVSCNDDQSSANDDGLASSVASSVHTTASNAPTEIYKSDLEKSPQQKRSNQNTTVNPLPIILIDNASDSSSHSRSPSTSPKISRRRRYVDRRASSVSAISMNLACLEQHNIDLPRDYSGRSSHRADRRRRSAVKFGATLGSFSSVSENDIALFSIPLWLALLLLFIYLVIGAFCYSQMENWAFIDSFYYAFISLSTIGFGDLYFVPEKFEGSLIFNFIYCFFGLSFVSMVWGLSSREFTLFARRIGKKLGYYKSRRWKQSFKGWTSRMRQRSIKRWSSRRRNAMKAAAETNSQNEHMSDISTSHSSNDEASPRTRRRAGHAES